jgi:hypothetical protein
MSVFNSNIRDDLYNRIDELDSKLAEKDSEYLLIRDHNKNLCDQLQQTKALLDKATDLLCLYWDDDNVAKYAGHRDFLAKVKGDKKE